MLRHLSTAAAVAETGLTITNPLVLYRALVATKQIDSDPAQHRLALHLQRLYHRLKDYEPAVEYRHQLEQVTRALARPDGHDGAQAGGRLAGMLDGFRRRRAEGDSLALTRRLTSQDAAMNIDSPQGLLLYGEVGTGKSMLVDLLADSLPNKKKRRYHFNAFMLDLFAQIEQQRIQRSRTSSAGLEQEHTLLSMARDLISTSPILFLDEFQLPDRAASKILANLFTSFFQLGGVLIATSNRMPEELSKASGVEFAAPSGPDPRLGFAGLRSFLHGSATNGSKRINQRQSDFSQFLEVLKARCETWNMESKTDFRRRGSGSTRSIGTTKEYHEAADRVGTEGVSTGERLEVGQVGPEEPAVDEDGDPSALPSFYFQTTPSLAGESAWQASILRASNSLSSSVADIPWQQDTLNVYGRKVLVPRAYAGTCVWTFDQLCGAYLGPADYMTLASTYHTLALSDVPVLTSQRKNEARRFITLLDALYESRCRLLVRADTAPDDLFFPDQRHGSEGSPLPGGRHRDTEGDGVYAETLSEIYQDQVEPFRPNVSAYGSNGEGVSGPEMPNQAAEGHRNAASMLADEDADFGPVYGAGRSAGASQWADWSEQGPGTSTRGQFGPDFQRTQALTGQDERFAYKRAESRLWELCSQRWWDRGEQGQWWKPLTSEARGWERDCGDALLDLKKPACEDEDEVAERQRGKHSYDGGSNMFRHGASPFHVHAEAPPKMAWTHIWGMMRWGNKAGVWGQGTEGIEQRLENKQREKERVYGKQKREEQE